MGGEQVDARQIRGSRDHKWRRAIGCEPEIKKKLEDFRFKAASRSQDLSQVILLQDASPFRGSPDRGIN